MFNDTATGMVGRAVWTDDRGDQIFSEITGNGDSTGNHFVGRFLGGTGRYAGASGDYEFSLALRSRERRRKRSGAIHGPEREDPRRVCASYA